MPPQIVPLLKLINEHPVVSSVTHHPLTGPISAIGGSIVSTTWTENLNSGVPNPKVVALFYLEVAKSCWVSTGSKRVACVLATGICAYAFLPGTSQPAFILACTSALRGANQLS